MLKQFGALPTERRARQMKERDYLWCLLNQLLDDQEELDQLCPTCRAEAEQERCPGCGALIQASGVNPSFDMERFRRLKEIQGAAGGGGRPGGAGEKRRGRRDGQGWEKLDRNRAGGAVSIRRDRGGSGVQGAGGTAGRSGRAEDGPVRPPTGGG